MRFRNSRVRTKVTALLLSLAALWVFAAWVTLREGVNLLWVSTLDSGIVQPSEPLLVELQHERRLTLVNLGAPSNASRKELEAQRGRTDTVIRAFKELSADGGVSTAASPILRTRLADTVKGLDGLAAARDTIDKSRIDRLRAADVYSDLTNSIYRMYVSLAGLDDEEVSKDARTLVELTRAREIVAQEDALLSGALAAGRLTAAEHSQFAQLVGAQRAQTDDAVAELPKADKDAYQELAVTPDFVRMRVMEDTVIESGRTDMGLVLTSGQWRAVADAVLGARQQAVEDAGKNLLDRAAGVAIGVLVRLALAGGLGLLAVIASIVLSITTARALFQQLEKLRTAALELANERLPSIVNRLAHGEKVDVASEAPPLEFGDDVIGQVGHAFNAVQETAIKTAVDEAELRQSIRDILLSLARRTQGLVHRQLTLLDVMERRESEPEELNDLFRVDHLATRMRRNAENLIVLSGASPARAWRNPVPMVDVVRGALGEVEDFTRVTIMPMGQVELTGRAVGDVIHLLAELVENAVSFSPPYTVVQVAGQMVANGYALEVEDRGLGMSAEDLAAANQRILEPPEFNLSSTARLGLFVVSRLAERHGIRVQLKASPYGGTTAVVLLPRELVVEDELVMMSSGLVDADPLGAPELPRMAVVAQHGRPTDPLDRAPEPPRQQPLAAPVATPVTPIGERRRPELVPDTPDIPRVPEAPVPESFTPSGLPFRVPQASIAPSLRDRPVEDLPEDEDDDRSPEDIRKIMGSYQSGTQRGRSEAARLLGQQKNDEDYR
ncbi:nitrate- and nitrite sensing domain-containing protein [Acrocarpospora sp. B8E8]|uniref:sensor histidine kinase n=1 Tax=Acrocarpospora sp. B8E8 TaxID=3153572 RepID=UPI00325E6C7E